MIVNTTTRNRRILVVDDEPSLRIGFEVALADQNREIVSMTNGQDAVDLLNQESFDLVLLDLNMPGLTGLDVLKAIRQRGDLTHVVICSAHISERAVLYAVRHGVVDFLAKPISLSHLREFVTNILEQQEEAQSKAEKAFNCARMLDFDAAARLLEATKEKELSSMVCYDNWLRVFKILSAADELDEIKPALPDARVLAQAAVLRQ